MILTRASFQNIYTATLGTNNRFINLMELLLMNKTDDFFFRDLASAGLKRAVRRNSLHIQHHFARTFMTASCSCCLVQ